MALSNPVTVFGVHSVAPYNKADGIPYGIVRVLGGSTFELSGETIELRGGSQRFPYAVEDGDISANLNLTVKEYPDFLFEVFLGKAPTAKAADNDGELTTATNVKGLSVIDASDGISGVSATSSEEDDLKFGKYIIEATGSDTVTVKCLTNIDFQRGADATYENDDLEIIASDITVSSGANTISGFGITLTGVGTPAFTTGDTAEFYVYPIHTGGFEVTIGGATDTFSEFGAVVMASKGGDGRLFEIDIFRLKGSGLPIGFEEKAFSESSITAVAFYDSTKDGICQIRTVLT